VFAQVIQGRTSDADGLRRQFDRWQEEVGPGATGYLGTTAGITDDGTVFVLARFADEATARTNSDRPEQGAWWAETEKYFDGAPSFADYTDVDVTNGGGSDAAGFVQVMQGTVTNPARVRELEESLMPRLSAMRPDVIGMVRAWQGDAFTQVVYFSSEADARQAEQAPPSGDSPPEFGELMSLMGDITYLDIKDPILRSA
jgi:hypothetical protein